MTCWKRITTDSSLKGLIARGRQAGRNAKQQRVFVLDRESEKSRSSTDRFNSPPILHTHTHLRTIALAKSLVISNDFRLDLVSPIYTKKRSYFFFSVLKTRFLFFFFFPKARTPFFLVSTCCQSKVSTIHRNLDALREEQVSKRSIADRSLERV